VDQPAHGQGPGRVEDEAAHGEHGTVDAGRSSFLFAPQRLYPLAPDACGQVFGSRLAGAAVEVSIPDTPPHAVRAVDANPAEELDEARRSRWIVPRTIELTIPGGIDPHDPKFGSTLRRWWALTTDWLGAWVGEPAASDVPLPRLVLPAGGAPDETLTPAGFMRLYGLAGEAHASSPQFARALQLAGEGVEVPPAYALLLRAGSALTTGEHRISVMEACSAAEVAAGGAIREALAGTGCPASFGEGVARRARGLRAAHEVLLELRIPCGVDKGDVTKLAKPRRR
jgi:hypothetical protein